MGRCACVGVLIGLRLQLLQLLLNPFKLLQNPLLDFQRALKLLLLLLVGGCCCCCCILLPPFTLLLTCAAISNSRRNSQGTEFAVYGCCVLLQHARHRCCECLALARLKYCIDSHEGGKVQSHESPCPPG